MAVAEKNCHHGIVSMAWYALNDDQNRRPERSTLKLPSRFNRRCWLSRDTTAPNPRSRRSCSLTVGVVGSVAIEIAFSPSHPTRVLRVYRVLRDRRFFAEPVWASRRRAVSLLRASGLPSKLVLAATCGWAAFEPRNSDQPAVRNVTAPMIEIRV